MQVPHESKSKTSESLQKMPESPNKNKQTKKKEEIVKEIFDLRHVPFYQYHSYLN